MSSILPILSPSASTRVRPCHPSTSWTVGICRRPPGSLDSGAAAVPGAPVAHEPGFRRRTRWRCDAQGERVGSAAMAWHVVIAGGGFGGLYAARTLERVLPKQSTRVTLVNDVNFMLYTPLLPGAAAGTLEPRHVVVPLREELHETDLRLGTVVGADPAQNRIAIRTAEGHEEELSYDQLIVSLGSVSRSLRVPGLAEYAKGF